MTHYGETLLHLACRQIWIKLQEIKEDLTEDICRQDSVDKAGMSANYCADLEDNKSAREKDLFLLEFPVLELLLDCFKMRPDLVEVEDRIPTSPGTPMHYFACFNYLDGLKKLLEVRLTQQ